MVNNIKIKLIKLFEQLICWIGHRWSEFFDEVTETTSNFWMLNAPHQSFSSKRPIKDLFFPFNLQATGSKQSYITLRKAY